MIFDLLLAFFAFWMVVAVKPSARWLPTITAGAALFLPTVVMNSSAWAQCDSIYASLCLGSLHFLIKRRPWLACVMFGLAFAFKLQAVFVAPVLLGVLLINRMRVRALLAVPVAFFAALLPATLAGRSLVTQLLTYPSQITDGSGTAGAGGGGGFGGARQGTGGAPSGSGVQPGNGGGFAREPAEAAGAAAVRAGRSVAVLTVLAIFVGRGWIAVAACIQAASITTYLAYLDNTTYVPLGLAAVAAMSAAVVAAILLLRALRRDDRRPTVDRSEVDSLPSWSPTPSTSSSPPVQGSPVP